MLSAKCKECHSTSQMHILNRTSCVKCCKHSPASPTNNGGRFYSLFWGFVSSLTTFSSAKSETLIHAQEAPRAHVLYLQSYFLPRPGRIRYPSVFEFFLSESLLKVEEAVAL